jgi:hypothetical protein
MSKILTEYLYLDELMKRWGCDISMISALRKYSKTNYQLLKLYVIIEERIGVNGDKIAIVDYLQSPLENTPPDTIKKLVADIDNIQRVENQNSTALRFNGTDYITTRPGAICGKWTKSGEIVRLFPEDKETKRLLHEGIITLANEYNPHTKQKIKQHGILSVIIEMRNNKSEREIARFLKDNGLSSSQIGALLHPDPLGAEKETIISYGKRLLKSTD